MAELPLPSYTVNTLDALSARHPEARFRPVMGADLLPDLPRWHQSARLQAEYAPIVVGRGGYPSPGEVVEFPAVSSTEIRRRLAAGEAVAHLLPAGVRPLVDGLYRG